ncbi:SDR family NAD(P)-dependent oxidoreductase [Halorubrum ezzemoulense]|uniref:SDR family NAD(P)-dependent oxidoreductase n=1 Tax=Halorubrum ezzemoulense TaxID=337243 RepID=UPI000BBBAC29|nr:SDR family NAD(P)-dependent oxidoreductase [Halorubrum ezzemoulense]
MTPTTVVAGVGPGLGSSVARRFAADGDDVALFARSSDYLSSTAAEIQAETPGSTLPVETDIADPTAVASAFETVRDAFSPVDRLVFTSGSPSVGGGIVDVDPAGFRNVIDTRRRGAFRCLREAVDDMVDEGGGTVVVTSSGQSRRPSEDVAYAAARHGTRGLVRSLAADPRLGEADVQAVHLIVDGWIDKPSLRDRYPDHDRWMDPNQIAERIHDIATTPGTVHANEIDLRHPRDEPSF